MAAISDAVVVCVRWRATPANELLRTIDMLRDARANPVATVLTRVDRRAHARGSYGYAGLYRRRREDRRVEERV